MTVRLAVWAAYWAVALALAAIASLAAALPFTGPAANLAGVVVAGGVCLVACACAPTTPTFSRKDTGS
ncbi:hypothetical protein [Streptomyces aureus]